MKKLLITGFEPFGGETVNPSWIAVNSLPDEINGYRLTKLLLPVVFSEAAGILKSLADTLCPDVILCIGQAGGRSAVTPELVAINLRHATIPDNKGNSPKDEPIVDGGAAAHFSTVPVRAIAEAINSHGIPSQVSYSAGAYVCNDILYSLLDHCASGKTRVGFIHIPYSEEQAKEPYMATHDVVKALTAAIEAL